MSIVASVYMYECNYCGCTQTLPAIDDGKKLALFDRANLLVNKCEFDRAQVVYYMFTKLFPNEAEGHWGMFLCQYGAKYALSQNGRKELVCHKIVKEKAEENEHFIKCLENADIVAKSIYKEEMRMLGQFQEKIKNISQEESFDIYIACKEYEEEKQTRDSIIGKELYQKLKNMGLKVFFPPACKEEDTEVLLKSLAALENSKIFLLVCTKAQYFSDPLYKNTLNTFLPYLGEEKTAILLHKSLPALDIPDKLSLLPSIDISKGNYIDILIEEIKKHINVEGEKKEEIFENTKTSSPHKEDEYKELLKQGMDFLKKDNVQQAVNIFDGILEKDETYAPAYLGKLMAEFAIKDEKDTETFAGELQTSENYEKILLYGNEAIKEKIEGYTLLATYNKATNIYNTANNDAQKYEKAEEIFSSLGDFKDSPQKTDECREKAKESTYEKANALYSSAQSSPIEYISAMKIYETLGEYRDSENKIQECTEKMFTCCEDKLKNAISGSLSVKTCLIYKNELTKTLSDLEILKDAVTEEKKDKISLLVKDIGLNIRMLDKKAKYYKASELMDSDTKVEISGAAAIFKELGSFMDSPQKLSLCLEKIKKLEELATKKEQEQEKVTKNNKDDKNKKDKKTYFNIPSKLISFFGGCLCFIAIVCACFLLFKNINVNKKLQNAKTLLNEGNYAEGIQIYTHMGKSGEKALKKNLEEEYTKAQSLYNEGKLEESIKIYNNIQTYGEQDWKEKIKPQKYQIALAYSEKGNYLDAMNLFKELGSYADSLEKFLQAKYNYALNLSSLEKYSEAMKILEELGNYEDSKAKAVSLYPNVMTASKEGNDIYFGNYEDEALSWHILYKGEKHALVISSKEITNLPFNTVDTNVTYENSSLRKWLSEEFLNTAFTQEEKEKICSTPDTTIADNGKDPIFLLSCDEYEALSRNKTIKAPTKMCWLRSPGKKGNYSAVVTSKGEVLREGRRVDSEDIGVRAAMWLSY